MRVVREQVSRIEISRLVGISANLGSPVLIFSWQRLLGGKHLNEAHVNKPNHGIRDKLQAINDSKS